MAKLPEPGWYLDPTDENDWRWWDGSNWTERVADNGVTGTAPLGSDQHPAPITERRRPAPPRGSPEPDWRPTIEFAAGRQCLVRPSGASATTRPVIVDERSDRVAAALADYGEDDVHTCDATWRANVVRGAVTLRTDGDELVGSAHRLWRPGRVYNLWIAPDCDYRFRATPLRRSTWTIQQSQTPIARLTGAHLLDTRVETFDTGRAVPRLAAVILLAVETKTHDNTIPTVGA